jgi:hypothetical protein
MWEEQHLGARALSNTAADARSLSTGTATTVSSMSLAATWTTSATLGVGTTSDTGVGGAAVEGRVNEGADTGAEHGGGDSAILHHFGALSLSPPTVSSSLSCLSSQGLFVVVSTTMGVVGAAA